MVDIGEYSAIWNPYLLIVRLAINQDFNSVVSVLTLVIYDVELYNPLVFCLK